MKKIILSLLFLPLLVSAQNENRQRLLGVDIGQKKDQISIENVYLTYGYKTQNTEKHTYTLQTLNNKTVLNSVDFNLQISSFAPDPNWIDPSTGKVNVPKSEAPILSNTIFIPFSPDVTDLKILDKNKNEVAQTSLKEHIQSDILEGMQKHQVSNTTKTSIPREKRFSQIQQRFEKLKEAEIQQDEEPISKNKNLWIFLGIITAILATIFLFWSRKN